MGIPTGAAWMQPSEPEDRGEGEADGAVVVPLPSPRSWTTEDRELLYAAIAKVTTGVELARDLDEAVAEWDKVPIGQPATAAMGLLLATARSAVARVLLLEAQDRG